jgi:hydroxypyruvate isomerase
MTRFSANLGFLWPDRPLLARIDAAAHAGFKAVELHYPYAVPAAEVAAASAWHRAARHQHQCRLGRGPACRAGGGAGRREFAALFDQAHAYAVAAGGNSIHVMAGRVPEPERAAAAEVIVANLRQAAPKAAADGLTILLEPLNPFDMPGYFYSRVTEALPIIDRVGARNVNVFDTYHVGGSATTSRHLDATATSATSDRRRAEPGRGGRRTLDYVAVLRQVEACYKGWVGASTSRVPARTKRLGWLAKLGAAD